MWITVLVVYFLTAVAAFGAALWLLDRFSESFDITWGEDVRACIAIAIFWPLLLLAAPFIAVYVIVLKSSAKH